MASHVLLNPSNFFSLYVTPAANLLIGIAVGFIALRQWLTARDKLRFDLYGRRLSVFDAAMDYLEMAIKAGEGMVAIDEDEVRRKYVRAWRESRFLFGKGSKVYSILEDMQYHAIVAMAPIDPTVALYKDDSYKEAQENKRLSVNWLFASADELAGAMQPFLDFRKLQSTSLGSGE